MSKRFYPETMPTFPNEPTADRFDVRDINDHAGQGVISLVEFQPGDVVFTFAGFVVPEITQFTLQFAPGVHIHDPFFMGKVLHSCDPNMACDMQTRTFTALKPIQPGDIITMDYETTEDVLFKPFECGCGSANCRGMIRGRLLREPVATLNGYK